ncbi:hypothetical protein [Streptomyces taklimakanensis]|nr:hypothetical protein [Streptomyces taklimakanensis]
MSMDVSVTIERSRLERLLRLPGGLVERNLRRRTERVAARARQLAPGSMGRYITTEVGRGPRGLTGSVISNHPATVYVVNGTRPHIIRPRRARALRFQMGGRTVFAKIVHHPGTDANDFLSRALREVL